MVERENFGVRCAALGYVGDMHHIELVETEAQRLVIRRLFGEYQRGVEQLLNGSDVCP